MITGNDLIDFVSRGAVKGGNVVVNRTEIDVHLGQYIWREKKLPACQRVHSLGAPLEQLFDRHEVTTDFSLAPGEFIRAETRETFDLPHWAYGILTLRSFAAQAGLEQLSSLTLKPSWKGTLILELSNMLKEHSLVLQPDAPIAQIAFFELGRREGGKPW
jgi:deoxycytidine triphosphate deaminase